MTCSSFGVFEDALTDSTGGKSERVISLSPEAKGLEVYHNVTEVRTM